MEIVEATKSDIPEIRNLAHSIWPAAYGKIISSEQLQYMLGLIYSNTALSEQFDKGHRFIIARDENANIGFASFSAKSDSQSEIFRLHKLYVLTDLHKKGFGSLLMDHVIGEAKKHNAKALELNVNKYNPAKAFYEKKGFIVLKDEVIDIGEGYVMDDYVMIKYF